MKIKINDLNDKHLVAFYGKTVDVFLNVINPKYDSYSFLDEPPGIIQGCVFFYDTHEVYIFIDTRNYVKAFDPQRKWIIDDFIHEVIKSITLKKTQK